MRRLVVWGAGELGGRVAAAWARDGGEVLAFTETTARHARLKAAGARPHVGEPVDILTADDALLLALPGSDRQAMAVSRLQSAPRPARAVLISSTGFYGQPPGKVDEDTPPAQSLRAAKVVGAEAAFRAWIGGAPGRGVVLRMGGLYRPGRGPLAALQRRGHAPLGPPDQTLALIHYDDAATATRRALSHPAPAPTYLCVVPPCPTRQDFYLAACVLLDLPLPSFEPPLKRRLTAYDTSKLGADLLPTPAHPKWQGVLVPGTGED